MSLFSLYPEGAINTQPSTPIWVSCLWEKSTSLREDISCSSHCQWAWDNSLKDCDRPKKPTLWSVLGKSHRYISWTAEVFTGCLGWSNSGVLTPGRAKFSKYVAEVGEDPSLAEWFCFKNDLLFLQRHRPFVCWCSAAPLRDKTRLCRVCSGKTGAGFQPDTSKSLARAPVYPWCFLPFVVVPKRGHWCLHTPAVSYSPASTSSRTLSTLLIFSTDWRGSLMQVSQWNLYNPDVNPVASPSGLGMSGNEHYWADKISEHFFHRKPTDFHLRVWHASSLRLLERHTLDCCDKIWTGELQLTWRARLGWQLGRKKTLYSLLSALKMCSGKD